MADFKELFEYMDKECQCSMANKVNVLEDKVDENHEIIMVYIEKLFECQGKILARLDDLEIERLNK